MIYILLKFNNITEQLLERYFMSYYKNSGHWEIKDIIQEKFSDLTWEYKRLLENIKDSDNPKDILKFREFIPENVELTDDKLKIILALIDKDFGRNNEEKVLSFIEQISYGWHDGVYRLDNSCLSQNNNNKGVIYCRKPRPIINWKDEKNPYTFINIKNVISKMFFANEHSPITLLIFSYCIASLFVSRLEQARFNIPFLQIACDFDDKNNSVYRLIQEIVTICDINLGIRDRCKGECKNYNVPKIIYPTHEFQKQLNELNYKDTPVIIDGREHSKYYRSMLRETANISNRRKPLDMRNKFNLLPLFICPKIESSFHNVLDFDLTGEVIDEDYIKLVKRFKLDCSSWVFLLVTCFDAIAELPKTEESSLVSAINDNISQIRIEHTGIPLKDVDYIGFLSFFFQLFVKSFESVVKINAEDEYKYFEEIKNSETGKDIVIQNIIKLADKSLVKLNRSFIPEQVSPIEIEGVESTPAGKKIANEIKTLSRKIEKAYRGYRVGIHINKGRFENEKYILDAQLLSGNIDDIKKNEPNVQQLLRQYELFSAVIEKTSIQFIVAKKLLMNCDLMEILKSPAVQNSSLKLPYAIGRDIFGDVRIVDFAEFPHLLIGGASGAGKSSALHCLIMSIIYTQSVNDVNLLLLDFGGSYLDYFNDAPHLSCDVITDTEIGRRAIDNLQNELERRRNIRKNNQKEFEKMPSIVCVIDEFIHFIEKITSQKGEKDWHEVISDLIGRGRKERIHIVLSALNPKADNIRCDISSITARIALRCHSIHHSLTIIGETIAENLVGRGTMYFRSIDDYIMYIQGSYIPHENIPKALLEIDFTNDEKYRFRDDGKYKFVIDETDVSAPANSSNIPKNQEKEADNALLTKLAIWALEQDRISNNRAQTEFHMGHNRVYPILKQLEQYNFVNQLHGNLGWQVIPTRIEDIHSELREILSAHDFSDEKITAALNKRTVEADSN